VLVVADDGYKFALIAIRQLDEGPNAVSVMDDIGWLDIQRIADDPRENPPFPIPSLTGVNPPCSARCALNRTYKHSCIISCSLASTSILSYSRNCTHTAGEF
jgi:hypothetical protein